MSRLLQFGSSSFTAAAVVLLALGLMQSTNTAQANPPAPALVQCATDSPTCTYTLTCPANMQECHVGVSDCPCAAG